MNINLKNLKFTLNARTIITLRMALMGDHQGRTGAVNLGPFVGVDLTLTLTFVP